MLADKAGDTVRFINRNAVDYARRFRELAAAVAKLRPDAIVLHGEVALFDEHLVCRFHLRGDPDTGVLCTPPMFVAFETSSKSAARTSEGFRCRVGDVILEDGARLEVIGRPTGMSGGKMCALGFFDKARRLSTRRSGRRGGSCGWFAPRRLGSIG